MQPCSFALGLVWKYGAVAVHDATEYEVPRTLVETTFNSHCL